jgi:hypothetical protein
MLDESIPDDFVAKHVFGDINDRLPLHVRQTLDELLPHKGAKAVEKKRAFQSMQKYLQSSLPLAFPEDATSWCYRCKVECPLRCSSAPVVGVEGFRPLTVKAAGSTCTGWSSIGRQQQDADPAMRPFIVYTQEMRACPDDISFHENSARMHEKQMLQTSPPGHACLCMVISLDQLGWPLMRNRMLSFSYSQESLVWVGPEHFKEEFVALFHRLVSASGDDFILDEDSSMADTYRRMASLRGDVLPSGFSFDDVPPETLLPPYAASIYRIIWSSRGNSWACLAHTSLMWSKTRVGPRKA